MPLFRCPSKACQMREYEAASAPCPECGYPEPAELVTIHFDPPHRRDQSKRSGLLACDLSRSSVGIAAVSEASIVNCPRCKASESFLREAKVKRDE